MRTKDGPCDEVWMVTPSSRYSATETSGSSGVCITCWVRKVCSNTCVGRGEGLVDVAAPQAEIERDIGALAALEMLQVGEGAGGLELVVHERLVLGRLDLVEHRRQFLVLGDDQLRRLLGDVRIGGEHDRDRLADEMHLADGEDRLVVEGRAVIGIGDHLADVVAGVRRR